MCCFECEGALVKVCESMFVIVSVICAFQLLRESVFIGEWYAVCSPV